jgi:hypothetical protein
VNSIIWCLYIAAWDVHSKHVHDQAHAAARYIGWVNNLALRGLL